MKLNPFLQERNNEQQVSYHNKDNTKINNVNGKSEISVITNCINNYFENNNNAMKDTDNMKEIINKNIDTESNKQIGENTEKDVRTKEKGIRNVSENCTNAPL